MEVRPRDPENLPAASSFVLPSARKSEWPKERDGTHLFLPLHPSCLRPKPVLKRGSAGKSNCERRESNLTRGLDFEISAEITFPLK